MTNNIFEKSKILVLFIFLAVAIYFGVLPRIINVEKYEPQIRETLGKSLENPVFLGSMDSRLTWNLRLKINVDKLSVCHKGQICFASSGPTSFELSLPYLLIHKIKIKKIELKNPYFVIKRLTNGHFDFERLFSGQNKVAVFDNAEIVAQDYKVLFVDDFLSQRQSFVITGKKLRILDFNPQKSIKVDVIGSVLGTKKPHTFFDLQYSSKLPLNTKEITKNNLSLKGKIENLYPSVYLPYLQKYFPDYSSLAGVINSDFDINLHKRDFWSDDFKFNISFRDFVAQKFIEGDTLRSLGLLKIDVFAKTKKNKLILDKFTLNGQDVDIALKGELDKIDSEKNVANLKLFVKNTKIEALAYLVPDEVKVSYDTFKYLKKFKVKSNVSGSFDITGIGKKRNLFGDLNFTGFSITRNSQKISGGKVKLHFDGKVNYIDADVWSKPNEHLYVKGSITPQLNKISLGVKAQSIDFGPFTELLFAIREIFKFDLGYFVEHTDITGRGDSDVYIYGDDANHYLYGYLNFLDCKLDYSGLSQPFEHVFGKVKFHEDDIYYNNIKAFNLKSPMVINGKVVSNKKATLIIDSPRLNAVETRRLINESRDLVETKNAIKNMKDISGYFVAKLIFGHDKNNDFMFKKLKLDALEACSVTYDEVGFPIKILKGSILITDKETFFKEVRAEAFGIPAKVSGLIIYTPKEAIQNYIVNFKKFPAEKIHEFEISPIMSQDLKNIFQKFQNTRGYLDADLKFLSKGTFADIKFYDTDFVYKPLNLPTRVKNGRLIISPENIKFEAFSANVADSPIYFDGSIRDYQNSPLFDNFILDIPKSTSSKLLNDILTKNSSKSLLTGGSFGGKMNFNGPVSSLKSLGNLEFNDIAFGNIIVKHASLSSDSEKINLQDSDIYVGGQKFKVSAVAEASSAKPFKINQIQISAPRLDLNCLMESLKNSSNRSSQTTLAFVIENGIICLNEVIWKNFVATNFSSTLCLDENSVLSLPAFKFQAVNGTARGCASYNLKSTEVAGNFAVRDVPVSSFSCLFKMPPDEASGCLCLDANFCTCGKGKSEIIDNAEARIDFQVKDGYLKKLGKAQYLLMAQSTLMNGITNITLNQILNLVFPKNLGLFKAFGGTIIAREGSLMTNNLCLQSQNLGVLASGNYDIEQKRSDIILLGQLPKREVQKLGILGQISAATALGFVPGLNFLPGNFQLLGMLGFLPFLNQIPSANTLCSEKAPKYKKFLVRMLKMNNCQKPVGGLEWFEKLNEIEKKCFCWKN